MATGNHSIVTEFILAGLTEKPELQLPLFLFFLGVYVVTVIGNLGMITLTALSSHLHTPISHLHTPMYYFLSSLSFIDLCYSTVITPKMLVSFVTEKNIISYPECMTQLYFFLFFIISECHMLAVMAYDHYVAICKPLLYNITMSYQVCSWLIVEVYMMGLIGATVHTGCMLRVVFCEDKIINHYFCDLLPLLELSCSSTYISELVLLCLSAVNIVAPTLAILGSYASIIASILQIRSTEGRSKAFSTCSSHILAVTIFYGSLTFMYLQPSNVSSMDQGNVSSVFYTIIVPMLNPLIYSLRNKDAKVALKKIIERRLFCIKPAERIMDHRNNSSVTEFILSGLTELPELQLPLFLLFQGIYMVTVVGNLGMITLIGLSSHLHTPMYYFLSSLSFIDLCQATVITSKMLVNFVTEKNFISYTECMTQLYFFIVFAIAESHMLAAMAYDHYVAICNPLLYNVIMSYRICFRLTAGMYTLGITGSTIHTGFMQLFFSKANVVNHYFCDLFPLLQLACSSIYINELLVLGLSAFNILTAALTIFASYSFIISSILHIRSTEGRSKAFSTCSSHISAVTIFYGSAAFMFLQPSNVSSMDQSKVSSVFYTIIVPMLNPMIYSLRNKDVKFALKKILESRACS
ncbi:LOW QUALITY PROTEIN: uncharacterized protein ACIGJ3_015238 [Trichechus inunguis]